MVKLNRYERECRKLDDMVRENENGMRILMEAADAIACSHLKNKDMLVHTLGKQKGGSSTGGLGFLIKHVLIENKLEALKDNLKQS
jgi:hypothetical protein